MEKQVIATNRKARHDYFLLDTFEAGLALKGTEIKAIRLGHVSIKEAHVRVDGRQAWLVDAYIGPYEPASRENHEPRRNRRLLLHKREIQKMWESVRQKGNTIIPLQIYLAGGRAKIEIALARGKKKYDKRQTMAEQDARREIERAGKDR